MAPVVIVAPVVIIALKVAKLITPHSLWLLEQLFAAFTTLAIILVFQSSLVLPLVFRSSLALPLVSVQLASSHCLPKGCWHNS